MMIRKQLILFLFITSVAAVVNAGSEAVPKNPDPPTEANIIPTTRDMIFSVVQSAKMATDTSDRVMKTYENYFIVVSWAAGLVIAGLAILGGAGSWTYFKRIVKLKKEHEGILKRIKKQQDKIDKLGENAHANISASTTAGSANIAVTLFIYLKKFKILEDESSLKGLLEETDKLCSKALEYEPKEPGVLARIYGMQGVVFWEQGDHQKSCEAFKNAIENEPKNANILLNAACNFATINKKDEALDYLKKAIEIRPDLCDWVKNESMLNNIRDDPEFPCH